MIYIEDDLLVFIEKLIKRIVDYFIGLIVYEVVLEIFK